MEAEWEALAGDVEGDGGREGRGDGRDAVEQRVPRPEGHVGRAGRALAVCPVLEVELAKLVALLVGNRGEVADHLGGLLEDGPLALVHAVGRRERRAEGAARVTRVNEVRTLDRDVRVTVVARAARAPLVDLDDVGVEHIHPRHVKRCLIQDKGPVADVVAAATSAVAEDRRGAGDGVGREYGGPNVLIVRHSGVLKDVVRRVLEVARRAGRVVFERQEAGALERHVGRTAKARAERIDGVHPHGGHANVWLHKRHAVRRPHVAEHMQPRDGDGQRHRVVQDDARGGARHCRPAVG
eukprot:scaffold1977_cov63-Phaeocystis_antarctica.AAC.1